MKNREAVVYITKKSLIPFFSVALVLNFILFFIKLYVGLSANSISIYSDGINNFFDALSCAAAMLCFYFVGKGSYSFSKSLSAKAEQLISLGLSLVIFSVGFVFLYNSAERLMYPTPVWFLADYFYLLLFTAAVKLFMFFFLKNIASRKNSEVMRLMSVDSLTDFFITAVTVLTLYISQKGGYSLDAWGGIAISLFILVTAVKNVKQSVCSVLGLPEKKERRLTEMLIADFLHNEDFETEISFAAEKRIYVKFNGEIEAVRLEELKQRVYNETGIKLYIIK